MNRMHCVQCMHCMQLHVHDCSYPHTHRSHASTCTLKWYAVDTHYGLHTVYPYLNAVDTEACMCRVCPNITMCVRVSIGSRNRTIHNAFHISLHVSSGTEPTHQSWHTCSITHIHSSTHAVNTNVVDIKLCCCDCITSNI